METKSLRNPVEILESFSLKEQLEILQEIAEISSKGLIGGKIQDAAKRIEAEIQLGQGHGIWFDTIEKSIPLIVALKFAPRTVGKMSREEIQKKYHSPDQPGIMHAMFDEVVDFVIDNYDFQPAFDKKLSMKNFFDTYSNDIEGTLHNMSQDKLLEYLDGDIFIACASAATDIPEKDFVEYSLEYFGFKTGVA